MEEGLDTFIVIDGLPKVPPGSKDKLVKFLLRKLTTVGKTKEENVFMPMNEAGDMSEGFAFVEYETPAQAAAAVKALHATPLDKKHTIAVNKLTDIERYGREGRIDETYKAPEIEPFTEKEHLRWWLGDSEGRDQFVMYRGDNVGVYWNEKDDQPEQIVDRQHWTESFVQWSPKGTYLTSMHAQGVQLWGGQNWSRQKRFMHPGVNLVDFSPDERYITTWSHRPMQVDEGNPVLSLEEDGKNYIIWDVATGKPLRSFVTLDLPGPTTDAEGNPIKKKMQWPAFKWSADAKYVARMTQGQSISIYELPRMNLLERTSVKIEGIMDFEWCPANPQRDNRKEYEQLFCYWTPEMGSNPAKVGLMSVPSKEIVRTRNLFNVSDAKLHWQSDSSYVCVKVDRHSKSKKSLATNLEIFRVREKGVPVEVIDTIKDTVINFAWEPKGDRFVLITAGEVPAGSAVPPKTAVSFFCPEKAKGNAVGNFKLIKTIDKKNNNAIHWSPNGRFVVVATVLSQQSFDLDFWDFDFEGEKEEEYKDLSANLQLMATADHYGVTDIEWDPSGRYVATSASVWKHRMENGYHLYTFAGQALREEPVEQFKQWAWRPRPERLLSKEEMKNVRKNLREYSRAFEEADQAKKSSANKAVVDARRRMLEEWVAWRQRVEEDLLEERRELGLPDLSEERAALLVEEDEDEAKVVEEIFEEILEESEEVIE
ncbi:Eukaryotic translation initiation factor 3 subunit B [Teratosphaeria destructans]|uniref:Eukaryotic translation initiation factor 3 subunit B n=1 Tax=Teratosphaeria destructans TaxID=418781 RepID=A0A9W7SZM1_9PEZI|nr:Eukaryotic translation initiation factor 3 subunit B [Teratosphaeria destructans]